MSNSGSSQKRIQHKSQKTHFRRPELLPQAPTASKSPFPSCTSQLSPGKFARHRSITRLSHLTRSVPLTVSAKPKLTPPKILQVRLSPFWKRAYHTSSSSRSAAFKTSFDTISDHQFPSSPSNDIKIQYTLLQSRLH